MHMISFQTTIPNNTTNSQFLVIHETAVPNEWLHSIQDRLSKCQNKTTVKMYVMRAGSIYSSV